jgi:hypothetical protein
MQQLICINVLIIMLDVGLLGIEYASLFLLETVLKGFVYSIKLKFEFAILGRLVDAVGGRNGQQGPVRWTSFATPTVESGRSYRVQDVEDITQFVDLKKVSTDYKFAAPITASDQRRKSSGLYEDRHIEHVN